ncbi:SusD/RagB family nutrient-binding outer membrane lipoprotein [Sphingobacterium thalpophilum]|uniref:SusD/RagB family nutrient-binding outer membrane lipoprotein n=1 Tax=Sphingobacterium thalpophilum TaxID=259 RepID=UPI003C7067E6
MNTFIKKLKYTSFLAIILASGCTKNFEKINTDPDALTDVPPRNMLVNVLRNAADQFGGDVDGYGTFAGYIVKIQYPDNLSGLIPTNNTYGNRWAACYYNITQMNDLLKKTEDKAAAFQNIRIVARIWNNYMWSYLLDGWGDIPYSEAFKGRPEDGAVLKAKYDKQEDIFPAVLADLKALADELAAGIGTDEIGAYDIIYTPKPSESEPLKTQMLNWQKFCNSLRLRMAMRISAVAPALAKSTIEEIAGNKEKYPLIETNAENCQVTWPGTLPYMEPWYESGVYGNRLNNWGMFDIFIDHLKATGDPRIASVARKNNEGEYVGFVNGSLTNPSPLSSISWIGEHYINKATGTTPFYKACETYYMLAEAALLGYNVKISAKDAYERAVALSMEENNINATDVAKYLAGAGKFDGTMDRIYWDMWVALFKENFEAWSLYRRTGIPNTNYPSKIQNFAAPHTDQPWRLPYPNNEYLYNTENVKAAEAGTKDYGWGKRLWWAKDNGKQ